MPNNSTQRYQQYGIQADAALENAERTGHSFSRAERRFRKRSKNRRRIIANKLNGNVSFLWGVFCFLVILACIGLGYFQANAAQTSIATFFDPDATGGFSTTALVGIGLAISIIGMALGHLIHECFEKDELTGRRSIKRQFWILVAAAIGYVYWQYYLARNAAGPDAGDTGLLAFTPYIIVGLALIELLIGGLVLDKASNYVALVILAIAAGFSSRRMARTSRQANNYYRDYRFTYLNTYNAAAPANLRREAEGSENIRRAIAFYGGEPMPPRPDGDDEDDDSEAEEAGAGIGQANEAVTEPVVTPSPAPIPATAPPTQPPADASASASATGQAEQPQQEANPGAAQAAVNDFMAGNHPYDPDDNML